MSLTKQHAERVVLFVLIILFYVHCIYPKNLNRSTIMPAQNNKVPNTKGRRTFATGTIFFNGPKISGNFDKDLNAKTFLSLYGGNCIHTAGSHFKVEWFFKIRLPR
mmetsp:Transcript_6069/g.10249  ORF Transcript_6069/g.10249 Transcript_6069/m.10249 type:complete len:106 (+) Transcript_6069:75-392(+)